MLESSTETSTKLRGRVQETSNWEGRKEEGKLSFDKNLVLMSAAYISIHSKIYYSTSSEKVCVMRLKKSPETRDRVMLFNSNVFAKVARISFRIFLFRFALKAPLAEVKQFIFK